VLLLYVYLKYNLINIVVLVSSAGTQYEYT
jgi:hypothetical protein